MNIHCTLNKITTNSRIPHGCEATHSHSSPCFPISPHFCPFPFPFPPIFPRAPRSIHPPQVHQSMLLMLLMQRYPHFWTEHELVQKGTWHTAHPCPTHCILHTTCAWSAQRTQQALHTAYYKLHMTLFTIHTKYFAHCRLHSLGQEIFKTGEKQQHPKRSSITHPFFDRVFILKTGHFQSSLETDSKQANCNRLRVLTMLDSLRKILFLTPLFQSLLLPKMPCSSQKWWLLWLFTLFAGAKMGPSSVGHWCGCIYKPSPPPPPSPKSAQGNPCHPLQEPPEKSRCCAVRDIHPGTVFVRTKWRNVFL